MSLSRRWKRRSHPQSHRTYYRYEPSVPSVPAVSAEKPEAGTGAWNGSKPVSLFSEFLVNEFAGTTNRIRLDIHHISQTARLGKSQPDDFLTQ